MKTAFNFQQQWRGIFTIFIFCLLQHVSFVAKAQAPGQETILSGVYPEAARGTYDASVVLKANATYLPVYFNYRRRLLKYNGVARIDGISFLNMCRSIKDSAVQEQIARYDEFTSQKQKLGFAAMGSAFAAFACFGGSVANDQGKPELTVMLVGTGAFCVIAVPVIAIYSSVPHQKRKTVLFRDLPVAYNAYVERQQVCEASH